MLKSNVYHCFRQLRHKCLEIDDLSGKDIKRNKFVMQSRGVKFSVSEKLHMATVKHSLTIDEINRNDLLKVPSDTLMFLVLYVLVKCVGHCTDHKPVSVDEKVKNEIDELGDQALSLIEKLKVSIQILFLEAKMNILGLEKQEREEFRYGWTDFHKYKDKSLKVTFKATYE